MIKDIPEQAYGFGSPSSEFWIDRARFMRTSVILLIVFALLGLLDYWADTGRILLVVGFVPLGFAAYNLLKLFYNHDLRVIIFPEGLAQTKANTTTTIPWNDVSYLWEHIQRYSVNFIPVYSICRYTIETSKGDKMIFDRTLKGIDVLGMVLKNKIGDRLIPKAIESLKAGQTEQFGSLSLNNQGLTYKGKSLSWNELKGIRVWQGQIYVDAIRKSLLPFASLKYAQMPNAFIFLHLMKRFVNTN